MSVSGGGQLPISSLGLLSDVLVLRGVSETEVHRDRVVVRTPAEPNFWCGNFVVFRDDAITPERQVAQFRADFPDAGHVTLAWDAPGMAAGAGHAQLAAMGFEIDQTDVLTLTDSLRPTPAPEGIAIRPIQTDADWEQVTALQHETGMEEGYAPEGYESYLRGRIASRRRQVSEGWAIWLGAFDGDLLVGDLGVFVGDGTARFQSVETRASHRRKGICAALVTAGVDWAADKDAGAVPVIVALCDSPAGRTYRRCGFTPAERLIMAIRPPDGAFEAASPD